MSPLAKLLVYYWTAEGEIIADSIQIDIAKCLKNKATLKWLDTEKRPGEHVRLEIAAAASSLCGVKAVDKSISLLRGSDVFGPDYLFNILNSYNIDSYSEPNQQDDYEYCKKSTGPPSPPPGPIPRPQPIPLVQPPAPVPLAVDEQVRQKRSSVPWYGGSSSYDDALKAFDMSGFVVMSSLTVETRPCSKQCRKCRRKETVLRRKNVLGGGGAGQFGAVPEMAFAVNAEADVDVDQKVQFSRPAVQQQTGYSGPPPPSEAVQPVNSVRNYFPETWLWELVEIGDSGKVEISRELPGTITDWESSAICSNQRDGIGLTNTATVRAFQPFFVDYSMPYSVKRGEKLLFNVSVFNYMDYDMPLRVELYRSEEYQIHGSNTASFCLQSQDKHVQTFSMTFTELDKINITVLADVDENYLAPCGPDTIVYMSDEITKPLLVEPEGFPKVFTVSEFLCTDDNSIDSDIVKKEVSLSWDLNLPEDLVEGSERAEFGASGDLLGPTLNNLDNLVRQPTGCGEQNMVLFTPNLYVRQYLTSTNKLSKQLETRINANMKTGYRRELNYAHTDGSFSAFGNSDPEGSMWLTAFVLRSFASAREVVDVDDQVLKKASDWIISKQQENGCFPFVGKVLHSEMKGGVSKSTVPTALTAYVVLAMLEGQLPGVSDKVINEAFNCLSKEKTPTLYTQILHTYALSLAGEKSAVEQRVKELMGKAVTDDGLMHWEPEGKDSPALAVEMTSYMILTMVRMSTDDTIATALLPVKWVSSQRNSNGGFVSTQDTVLALQALAAYSMRVGNKPLDMALHVTAGDLEASIQLNDDSRLLFQRHPITTLPAEVTVVGAGEGCALVQATLRYNVHTADPKQAFNLNVSPKTKDCKGNQLHICTSYDTTNSGKESNMVVAEVNMISGYIPDKKSLELLKKDKSVGLKRYEIDGSKVNLYFDEITAEEKCFDFDVTQEAEVVNLKPAVVKIYDYYQMEFGVSVSYLFDECDDSVPHIEPLDDLIVEEKLVRNKRRATGAGRMGAGRGGGRRGPNRRRKQKVSSGSGVDPNIDFSEEEDDYIPHVLELVGCPQCVTKVGKEYCDAASTIAKLTNIVSSDTKYSLYAVTKKRRTKPAPSRPSKKKRNAKRGRKRRQTKSGRKLKMVMSSTCDCPALEKDKNTVVMYNLDPSVIAAIENPVADDVVHILLDPYTVVMPYDRLALEHCHGRGGISIRRLPFYVYW